MRVRAVAALVLGVLTACSALDPAEDVCTRACAKKYGQAAASCVTVCSACVRGNSMDGNVEACVPQPRAQTGGTGGAPACFALDGGPCTTKILCGLCASPPIDGGCCCTCTTATGACCALPIGGP